MTPKGFDFVLRDNMDPILIQTNNQPALGFMHAVASRAPQFSIPVEPGAKTKQLRTVIGLIDQVYCSSVIGICTCCWVEASLPVIQQQASRVVTR
jgi:hypothetical protein